jgi:KDO2-lipid IV(A) lauroyltransferase
MEYTAFRLVETVVRIAPIGVGLAVSHVIGFLWWCFDKKHRQVAHDNLRIAFGDTISEERRQQIIKGMYLHFSMVALEFIIGPRLIRRDTWPEFIDFRARRLVESAIARGRGVVMVSGHFGNFELLSYLLNMAGHSMLAAGKDLANPYMDGYMWRYRARLGERVINSKRDALRRMALALRRGECAGFIVDQDAGRRGIFADFFGKKASTHATFASFALTAKAPVLPGYACRVGLPMKYVIHSDPPIEPVATGDRERDVRAIVEEVNRRLESFIRQYPEQWLWTHRRWKTRPPEEAPKAEEKKTGDLRPAGATVT